MPLPRGTYPVGGPIILTGERPAASEELYAAGARWGDEFIRRSGSVGNYTYAWEKDTEAVSERVTSLEEGGGNISIGRIDVNPGRIAEAKDLDGTYQCILTLTDQEVVHLRDAGVNYLEIWFGTETVHVVSPWAPALATRVDAVVDTTEETAIGAPGTALAVRAVYRINAGGGQAYYAEGAGALRVGGFDETAAGDDLQSVTVNSLASFNSALAAQAKSDTPLEIVFAQQIVVTTGPNMGTYEVGDVVFIGPRSTSIERRFNAVSHAELRVEVAERREGDVWTAYSAGNAATLATVLQAHRGAGEVNGALVSLTGGFTTSTRTYTAGQRWYLSPYHTDEADMVLISEKSADGSGGGGELSFGIFPIATGTVIANVGADPVAVGFGAATREHGTGIARAAGNASLTLAKGTYEFFVKAVVDRTDTGGFGHNRANLRVVIEDSDGTKLDDQNAIGYFRGGEDANFQEGSLSQHVIRLTAATTVVVKLAESGQDSGSPTYTTDTGGTVTVKRVSELSEPVEGKDDDARTAAKEAQDTANANRVGDPFVTSQPDTWADSYEARTLSIAIHDVRRHDPAFDGVDKVQVSLAGGGGGETDFNWTPATGARVLEVPVTGAEARAVSGNTGSNGLVDVDVYFHATAGGAITAGNREQSLRTRLRAVPAYAGHVVQTVQFANPVTINADGGDVAELPVTGDTTLSLAGGADGTVLRVITTQPAAGGSELTLNNAIRRLTGVPAPVLSQGGNAVDVLYFQRIGTVWYFTAISNDVSLTDDEIGDKAFSNPPSDLSDAEKTAARTAIGVAGFSPTKVFSGNVDIGGTTFQSLGVAWPPNRWLMARFKVQDRANDGYHVFFNPNIADADIGHARLPAIGAVGPTTGNHIVIGANTNSDTARLMLARNTAGEILVLTSSSSRDPMPLTIMAL